MTNFIKEELKVFDEKFGEKSNFYKKQAVMYGTSICNLQLNTEVKAFIRSSHLRLLERVQSEFRKSPQIQNMTEVDGRLYVDLGKIENLPPKEFRLVSDEFINDLKSIE